MRKTYLIYFLILLPYFIGWKEYYNIAIILFIIYSIFLTTKWKLDLIIIKKLGDKQNKKGFENETSVINNKIRFWNSLPFSVLSIVGLALLVSMYFNEIIYMNLIIIISFLFWFLPRIYYSKIDKNNGRLIYYIITYIVISAIFIFANMYFK